MVHLNSVTCENSELSALRVHAATINGLRQRARLPPSQFSMKVNSHARLQQDGRNSSASSRFKYKRSYPKTVIQKNNLNLNGGTPDLKQRCTDPRLDTGVRKTSENPNNSHSCDSLECSSNHPSVIHYGWRGSSFRYDKSPFGRSKRRCFGVTCGEVSTVLPQLEISTSIGTRSNGDRGVNPSVQTTLLSLRQNSASKRKSLHTRYYIPSNSDLTPLKTYRVEQRKEKSRLAAQIRRNRESQTLMLLQIALPISTEVLGLYGLQTNSPENLLAELFDDEQKECIPTELCELVSIGIDQSSVNVPAVKLEKSDLIRIAGHTLFFLNHINQYLGSNYPPTLSLKSRSLYGIVVNPVDKRIVYATPALVELVGGSWVPLVGGLLRYLVQPLSVGSSVVKPVPTSSKRKSVVEPRGESADLLSSTRHAAQEQNLTCLSGFVRLVKQRCYPIEPLIHLIPDEKTKTQRPNHKKDIRKCGTQRRGRRKDPGTRREERAYRSPTNLLGNITSADWTCRSDEESSVICHCWASMLLKGSSQTLSMDALNLTDTKQCGEEQSSQPLHGIAKDVTPAGNSNTTGQPEHQLTQLQLYLLKPIPIPCEAVSCSKSQPFQEAEYTKSSALEGHLDDSCTSIKKTRAVKRKMKKQKACKSNPRQKPSTASHESPPNDMLNQFTTTDLSSLISPLESESSPNLFCTQLDNHLIVREVSGSLHVFTDPEEEFEICGQSFLSFIHPDDLEAVVNAFSETHFISMSWTPPYRVTGPRSKQPGLKVIHYVWIRSLVLFVPENRYLRCWHQSIGCESPSSHWVAFENYLNTELHNSAGSSSTKSFSTDTNSIKAQDPPPSTPSSSHSIHTTLIEPLSISPTKNRFIQITQADTSNRWNVLLPPRDYNLGQQMQPGLPDSVGRSGLRPHCQLTENNLSMIHSAPSSRRKRQRKASYSRKMRTDPDQIYVPFKQTKLQRWRTKVGSVGTPIAFGRHRFNPMQPLPQHEVATNYYEPQVNLLFDRSQTGLVTSRYLTKREEPHKFIQPPSTIAAYSSFGSSASSVCSSPEEMNTNEGINYFGEQPVYKVLPSPTLDELAQAALASMVDEHTGSYGGEVTLTASSPCRMFEEPRALFGVQNYQ